MLPGSSKTQPERVQLGDIRVQNWIPERGVDVLDRKLENPESLTFGVLNLESCLMTRVLLLLSLN